MLSKNMYLTRKILLVTTTTVMATHYYNREDFLNQEFDWSQLEVEERFFRNNKECSFIREEVTVFRYATMNDQGDPVNSTVTVAVGQEVDIRTFYDDRQPGIPGKYS